MSSDFRQFDEHGLPLPQKFVDMRSTDEELPRRANISPRKKRIFLLVVILCVVALVFGSQLVSMGRQTLGSWLQSRAERKLEEGDKRGALEDLSQAISWNPDGWNLYDQRSMVRLQLNELAGSRDDLTKAIDLLENGPGRPRGRAMLGRAFVLSNSYSRRSWINVRLNRGRDAVDDATHAVDLDPTSPSNFNTRAYARALCNLELSDGLADIDQAIAMLEQLEKRATIAGLTLKERLYIRENSKANFLDTRGYLLHLLDRNEEALKDLNRAIAMTEARANMPDIDFLNRRDFGDLRIEKEEYAHTLAVMHQHRGLVRQKLGQEEGAKSDLQRAELLGFDPENGVF